MLPQAFRLLLSVIALASGTGLHGSQGGAGADTIGRPHSALLRRGSHVDAKNIRRLVASTLRLDTSEAPKENPDEGSVRASKRFAIEVDSPAQVSPLSNPCKIFTFWDHGSAVPAFVEKNLESWSLHSKGLCLLPILVNDSNVRSWIPDLPAAYFQLPNAKAKAEAIRYALLYHNGGIFVEDDVLVVKNLEPIVARLSEFDLFSYATAPEGCRAGRFRSGFLGGKQGSIVFGAIWEQQRNLMALDCPEGLMQANRQVCCQVYDAPECDTMSLAQRWDEIGEQLPQRVFSARLEAKDQPRFKYHCFHGPESFEPPGVTHVTTDLVRLDLALKYFANRGERSPMSRIMYHFGSDKFAETYPASKLFDPKTFVGSLYRRSHVMRFQSPLEDGPVQVCAKEGETCECDGKVYFMQTQGDQGPESLQARFLDYEYGVREVAPDILCTEQAFGKDPAPTQAKHCLCQPWAGEMELLQDAPKSMPVLNLLFLVKDGIWNAEIWRAWLAQAPVGAAKVYVHCANFQGCMANLSSWSLPGMEVVPTVPSKWCKDLVTPQVQLLQKALSDSAGRTAKDKYIFFSESTLPLRRFTEVHKTLTADTRSAFCFFPTSHWGNMTEVTQGKESYWTKSEQWVTLNVADAEKLVRDWEPVGEKKSFLIDFHKMRNRPEWPETVFADLQQGPRRTQTGPCADEFAVYAAIWGVFLVGEQCPLDPKKICSSVQDLYSLRTCHTLTLWPYKPIYDDMEQLPKSDTELNHFDPSHPDHPVSFERVGLAGMHVLSESGNLFARKFNRDCTFEVPIHHLWDKTLPAANPEDPFGWLANKVAGWLIG